MATEKSNRQNAELRPCVPATSRFIAPWDTSGWYSSYTDFHAGLSVYSNTEARVISLPEKYAGADYILTFDSESEHFDDKQGVDFYTERACTVAVALDPAAEQNGAPACVADFVRTDETVAVDNGVSYVLYEKSYPADEHVHIDGLSGTGIHHFFVLIAPADKEPEALPVPKTPLCRETPAPVPARTYRLYCNEVFNGDDALSGFETVGEVTIRKRENDPRDGYAVIDKGCIIREIPDFGARVVTEARITPFDGAGQYMVCSVYGPRGVIACIVLHGGEIFAASRDENVKIGDYERGKEYAVGLVFDREKACFDAWLNSRLAAEAIPVSDVDARGVKFIAHTGLLGVDDVRIADDTEIYAVNEDFSASSPYLTAGEDSAVTVEPYPFEADRSAKLTSRTKAEATCAYAIPPLAAGTVEVKVKVTGTGFALAPELSDETGTPALRVAMFRNNLYATNGNEWVRLSSLTDWAYYPCGNWINIKITLSGNGTYTLMADSAVRARDFALMNPVSAVSRLAFSCEAADALYLNRVRVYDAPDLCRIAPTEPIFDVRDYGATGDGKTLDTAAIQKAIDAAAYTGGTVLLSGGTFYSGELFMKNDITFFVDRSATLLGTQDHGEYPLQEPGTSLCAVRQLGRGLIFGENVKNVRITGGGTLNGNGRYRFKMNDPRKERRVEDARPDIIYIAYSEGVTVENIHLRGSAFWTVVPLSCGNVILRHLDLDCMNTPNRDGIDPVDSHDMTIYDCNIMAGDDGLCFKSSDPVGCYNIDVHDMMIQSLASGIKFGTDTYYCLKNAVVTDCTVKNVNRCGISLETVDGALVENVTFERIDMTDVSAPVYITVGARNRLPRGGAPVRKSEIKHVTFRDLRFDRPYLFGETRNISEVMAVAQSPDQRMEDILFENCDFELKGGYTEAPGCPNVIDNHYPEYDQHGPSAGHAFTVRYAKNFRVKNVKVRLQKPDVRPFIAEFDCE